MAEFKVDRLHESNTPLKVAVVKGSNWNSITSIDFGGADVDFSGQDDTHHPFSGNTTITSITNCNIATNGYNIFNGCSKLETFDGTFVGDNIRSSFIHCEKLSNLNISAPNATMIRYAFQYCISLVEFDNEFPMADNCRGLLEHCSGLTNVVIDLPNATNTQLICNDCKSLTECHITMPKVSSLSGEFSGCTTLSNVELIVNKSLSSKTQSNFGIPSSAPCRAYKYVDDLGDGTVKLTFTNTPR